MLKLSTIEELRDSKIITLVQCDKSEKENDSNVVRDTSTNQYYKIEQTEGEIRIELLNSCLKSLETIKNIMIFFCIIVCLVIFMVFILGRY